ncbi:MAG TPA: hypothetical protein VNE39_09415 [Planctomycetota bacterium]|nr:hypothetical protein [Planctomycetota bacterium]
MALKTAKLSIWRRVKLLWGRPRRLFLNVFRPGYVRASLARRRGECRRCGACCQMGLYCRHLKYGAGDLSECVRYQKWRSSNCRNFPMDERDLAERDLVAPDTPCGYSFEPRQGAG